MFLATKAQNRRRAGFTLLEVIVSLTLLGLVAGGALSVVGRAAGLYRAAQTLAVEQPQLEAALAVLADAIRRTEAVASGSASCTFALDGVSVNFSLADNKLWRRDGTDSTDSAVLLPDVTAFSVQADAAVPYLYTVSLTVTLAGATSRSYTLDVYAAGLAGAANADKGVVL